MPPETTGESSFAMGLLDPAAPVPSAVSGCPPRRYAVYRNNATVGLMRALEANFPAIRRLLGEVFFRGLAREFLRDHPPRSPLLFTYGDAFADFLASRAELEGFPYLSDVARLEQLWRRAYHAEDQAVLTAGEMADLPEEELPMLRLAPHAAMGLLASPHAVHAIFTANRDGGSGQAAQPFRSQCVLVTRPRLTVELRAITGPQNGFLAALAGGATLAEAAETGLAAGQDFDLASAIALMLEAGVFQTRITGRRT